MLAVRDVFAHVEKLAPPQFAFSFDRIGLQVGDLDQSATGIVTTLDCTMATIDFANSNGSNIIVSHHPPIWHPLKTVVEHAHTGALVRKLVKSGVSLIVAHTNWDCALGGVNDALAARLELTDVKPFGSRSDLKAFKIVTFVPGDQTGTVSQALARAGAGNIGLYGECAFSMTGTGTFRGREGTSPAVGSVGELTSVREERLEMVVPASNVGAVVSALVQAHPYEEPAYDLVPIENSTGYPIGRIGNLDSPIKSEDLARIVDDVLGTKSLVWASKHKDIRRIAVVGGAADGEWQAALREGADAYLTGEIKHNVAVEASAAGLAMVQAGHFATEQPGMVAMASALATRFDLPVSVFEPLPGNSGRPL